MVIFTVLKSSRFSDFSYTVGNNCMTKVLLALVSTYAIGGGKMTTYDYDVLYIGSGHGTFDGAIRSMCSLAVVS